MLKNRINLIVYDFDGVMTDNRVTVDQDGKESVACNRGDGLGIPLKLSAKAQHQTPFLFSEYYRSY